MNKREKIDILLATYNGEKFLKEQLDSILNQTYENIRIVISDDASTDGTRGILKEYENNKKIEIYYQDENLGSTANFEFLLSKVTSKYYMFSDQDDVWFNDKVENTYAKMITDNAGLVCTDLMLVDEKLNPLGNTFNKKMKKEYKLKKYSDWRLVFLYNVVTGCTIMSKKEYIKDILPLPKNKNILHDHFIPLVIGNKAKISYLDAPTMMYRQHQNNQIGAKRYTDRFKNFDETRNYLIDLKISIFNTYLERRSILNDEALNLSIDAIKYFESIKKVKNIYFGNKKTFRKLYKYEKFGYRFWNSCLFNYPFVARIWYCLFKKKK